MSNTPTPDFLAIGQVIKPHGLKGEVSVKILTDYPERFETMDVIYLGDEVTAQPHSVESIRWHKDNVLITFKSFTDRNAAETLRGLYLKIPLAEAMPLEPDAYYHYQLKGLMVVTDTGQAIGQIIQILETGANDVYVVQGEQGEVLLPATKEVILDINLETGQMLVHLLDGLI